MDERSEFKDTKMNSLTDKEEIPKKKNKSLEKKPNLVFL